MGPDQPLGVRPWRTGPRFRGRRIVPPGMACLREPGRIVSAPFGGRPWLSWIEHADYDGLRHLHAQPRRFGLAVSGRPAHQEYLAEEVVGKRFSQFYTPEDQASGAPQAALDTALRKAVLSAVKAGVFARAEPAFGPDVIIGTRSAVRMGPYRDLQKSPAISPNANSAQETTGKAARESLFQSQKMDAVGQLTGGVAHDFNNLLMAVLGSLELLRKRLPDDPQMHRLLENACRVRAGDRRSRSACWPRAPPAIALCAVARCCRSWCAA